MRPSWVFDAGTVDGASWMGQARRHPHATISHEHYATLCATAVRANQGMVLDTRDSVSDHIRSDQLSATRRTTHRPHADAPP